jgi:copper(I)-binding protein
MPGLFGIFAKTPKLRQRELHQLGNRMTFAMRHTPWLRCEAWSDDSLCAGRVHLGVLDPKAQPIEGNDGS